MNVLILLLQAGIIILILFSAYHWIRTGFRVPKYIHFIAFFSLLVGVFLSYLAYSLGDVKAGTTISLVLGFPAVVYVIYGLYGGLFSKDAKINDGLIVDRAMLKDEVVEIFQEHFSPYTRWNFGNLLLLPGKEYRAEVIGKSGRAYLFELEAESYEGENGEKIVALYGNLTELKRKLYSPQARIVFEISRNGTIYRDGLNFNLF